MIPERQGDSPAEIRRRERKKAYIDLDADPAAPLPSVGPLRQLSRRATRHLQRPMVAWSGGLALGGLAGGFLTLVVAVHNLEWLQKPLWWAVSLLSWIS